MCAEPSVKKRNWRQIGTVTEMDHIPLIEDAATLDEPLPEPEDLSMAAVDELMTVPNLKPSEKAVPLAAAEEVTASADADASQNVSPSGNPDPTDVVVVNVPD